MEGRGIRIVIYQQVYRNVNIQLIAIFSSIVIKISFFIFQCRCFLCIKMLGENFSMTHIFVFILVLPTFLLLLADPKLLFSYNLLKFLRDCPVNTCYSEKKITVIQCQMYEQNITRPIYNSTIYSTVSITVILSPICMYVSV